MSSQRPAPPSARGPAPRQSPAQVRDMGRRRIHGATALTAAGGTALAVLFGALFAGGTAAAAPVAPTAGDEQAPVGAGLTAPDPTTTDPAATPTEAAPETTPAETTTPKPAAPKPATRATAAPRSAATRATATTPAATPPNAPTTVRTTPPTSKAPAPPTQPPRTSSSSQPPTSSTGAS